MSCWYHYLHCFFLDCCLSLSLFIFVCIYIISSLSDYTFLEGQKHFTLSIDNINIHALNVQAILNHFAVLLYKHWL